jgi:MFS transporter, FHS family, L-fucose permease
MTTTKSSNYVYQITIIGILFAVFGLITWLNGILIPFLKKACELTDQQSFLVTTFFFLPYFIMALPSSFILNKVGSKTGMMIGLFILILGSLIFIPAANTRSFPYFLIGLFIQGTGLALLQTAANPYVTMIGPIESAATRISFMGICNKLMGIVGNLILATILFKDSDKIQAKIDAATDLVVKNQLLDEFVNRVVTPYTIICLFLIIIALLIKFSNLPDIKEQVETQSADGSNIAKTSILDYPHVWLGALAIFFYVGAEVLAGDLIGPYGKNLGLEESKTKYFTSFGLTGLLVGYIMNIILIPKYLKQETWLVICAILALILSIISFFAEPSIAVMSIVGLGFANAVIWPAVFPLGISNLGKFTQLGSAILVMGIIGGALLPPFYGWLYENGIGGLNFRSAYTLLLVVCYVYILWFGLKGHKVGLSKK